MEEFSLYDYLALRKVGRRTVSAVQEIVDNSDSCKGMTGQEIVEHFYLRYSNRVHVGMGMIVKSYRRFCRDNGYKFEKVSIKRQV